MFVVILGIDLVGRITGLKENSCRIGKVVIKSQTVVEILGNIGGLTFRFLSQHGWLEAYWHSTYYYANVRQMDVIGKNASREACTCNDMVRRAAAIMVDVGLRAEDADQGRDIVNYIKII